MADEVTLPIVGRPVSQLLLSAIGFPLQMAFWSHASMQLAEEYTLVIEGEFTLSLDGIALVIRPSDELPPELIRLTEKTVANATASRTGALRIDFTDGDWLTIEPQRYEPWQLNGADGTLIVSIAGGGLSAWSPET
jgi:hypothetical protein